MILRLQGVRISSTFSVLRPFSYLRPFLYFNRSTSTSLCRPLYFDSRTVRGVLLRILYFEFFTSNSLLRILYFDSFTSTSVLRHFVKSGIIIGMKMVEVQKRSNWCVPTATLGHKTFLRPFWSRFTLTFLAKLYLEWNFHSTFLSKPYFGVPKCT